QLRGTAGRRRHGGGPPPLDDLQAPAPAHRRRAPPQRPARAAGPGGGAQARGPRPARRGEPGAYSHPAQAPGADARRAFTRAGRGARRAQAAREPGDGGAAPARPPASPERARRPRPDARARGPGEALRRPARHRGAAQDRGQCRPARRRPAARGLPRGPGGARERGAPLARQPGGRRSRGPRFRRGPHGPRRRNRLPEQRPPQRARPERNGRACPPRGRRADRPVRARRGDNRDPARALMLHILIADDHGIVRSGIRMLIDRQDGMRVVAEAEDGLQAVDLAQSTRPDVAILDVSMPRMTGLQAAREMKIRSPDTSVLLLSMHDDERYFFDAVDVGASGYVLKRAADTDLIDAIQAVARGEQFVSPDTERSVIKEWLEGSREERLEDPLTPRELDVVKLIAEAHTNKQIAEALHVSEKTVESHRANVLSKLGMRDRVELVRYAIRRGLVEP